MKSIKTNFILNASRLFLGMFFILITTPYVTRVLGTTNFGKVEYTNSIISYFILFTSLGIPAYGIREISRVRDDKKNLSKVLLELLIILIVMSLLGYFILYIILNTNKELLEYKTLIIISSLGIIFNNIGIEWFFQGIEDQKYITIRFITIRLLTLILLFLVIKKSEDYYWYALILVMMTSGSNLFNLFRAKRYIIIEKNILKELEILRHLRPIMTIFLGTIAVSVYLKLDSVMLGYFIGNDSVAYYSVANKLVRLIIVVITALGTVLLPRLTNSLNSPTKDKYNYYLNYSIKYILFVSLPAVSIIMIYAEEIILIMAGNQYLKSIFLMRMLAPLLVIVGVSYFLGYQILYPHKLEKYYTKSVTVAAFINFIFNYFLIMRYEEKGAVLGTLLAEFTGMCFLMYFVVKNVENLKILNKDNFKFLLSSLIMAIIMYFFKKQMMDKDIINFIIGITSGVIFYLLSLFILKELLVITIIKYIKNYGGKIIENSSRSKKS